MRSFATASKFRYLGTSPTCWRTPRGDRENETVQIALNWHDRSTKPWEIETLRTKSTSKKRPISLDIGRFLYSLGRALAKGPQPGIHARITPSKYLSQHPAPGRVWRETHERMGLIRAIPKSAQIRDPDNEKAEFLANPGSFYGDYQFYFFSPSLFSTDQQLPSSIMICTVRLRNSRSNRRLSSIGLLFFIETWSWSFHGV